MKKCLSDFLYYKVSKNAYFSDSKKIPTNLHDLLAKFAEWVKIGYCSGRLASCMHGDLAREVISE